MRKKITVYLDTSVLSALFDKRIPEMQFLTRRFFEHVEEFKVFVSVVKWLQKKTNYGRR
jgi:hypothetical protein